MSDQPKLTAEEIADLKQFGLLGDVRSIDCPWSGRHLDALISAAEENAELRAANSELALAIAKKNTDIEHLMSAREQLAESERARKLAENAVNTMCKGKTFSERLTLTQQRDAEHEAREKAEAERDKISGIALAACAWLTSGRVLEPRSQLHQRLCSELDTLSQPANAQRPGCRR